MHHGGGKSSRRKSNEQISLFIIVFCVQYAPVRPYVADIKHRLGYFSISFVCHLASLQIMLLSSCCG